MSGGHHAPSLSIAAILVMALVPAIYFGLKAPYKHKFHKENRITPKGDLAWRNASQKWLEELK